MTDLQSAVERLEKRAKEIEQHAAKYPSWNIPEAKGHAEDIRTLLAAVATMHANVGGSDA